MKRLKTKLYKFNGNIIVELKEEDILKYTFTYVIETKENLFDYILDIANSIMKDILEYQMENNCIVDTTGIVTGILKLKGGE